MVRSHHVPLLGWTQKSHIEWTEQTWNPVTGCTKVSVGCKHCYAERMALRLQAMAAPGYGRGFELTLHEDRLSQPLERKKPTVYFVCSMADLFHEEVPDAFIDRVLAVARQTPRHTYQILTKRAERLPEFFALRSVPPNVWLGVGGGPPPRLAAHRRSSPRARPRPLPVGGAAAGRPGAAGPGRDSVGYLWWRIGTGCPPDAARVSAGGAGPVRNCRRGVPVQAVGRLVAGRRVPRQEGQRPVAGGATVGRAAGVRGDAALSGSHNLKVL